METHSHSHKKFGSKEIASAAAVLIIACGVSFWGGMKYRTHTLTSMRGTFMQGMGGQGGTRAGVRGGMNGSFVTGDIIASDQTSITVKMRDGSSKIVLVPASASVLKSTAGSATDLVVGQSVTVTGTANADGSLNAQTVQIRPAGMNPQAPGR